jgi:hypothetical protein
VDCPLIPRSRSYIFILRAVSIMICAFRPRTSLKLLFLILAVFMLTTGQVFSTGALDFIAGRWTLRHATDINGTSWDDSTLRFTAQTGTATGFRLTGQFEWRRFGTPAGRENVTGTYTTKTRRLVLEGHSQEDPDGIVLAVYAATLSSDGRAMTSGTWKSKSGGAAAVPGTWTAVVAKR